MVENLRFSYVFERVCVSTAETRLQAMNAAAGFRFIYYLLFIPEPEIHDDDSQGDKHDRHRALKGREGVLFFEDDG